MRAALFAGLCLGMLACDEGREVFVPSAPGPRADAGDRGDAAVAGDDARAIDGTDAAFAREDASPVSPDAGVVARPDASAPAGEPLLARDLTLEDVSLFQAVKIALVDDGVAPRPRNGPVIAGRDALVRLYVRPGAGWTRRAVTAVLELDGVAHRETITVGGASIEDQPDSVFTFSIPGAAIREGATWSARLESADGAAVAAGASSAARWPRTGGAAPLLAQSDGGGLVLMLVPLRYETDGSNRLPDTSPAQLDRYRVLLGALYPVARVDLQVHAPVRWTRGLTFSGNVDFGEVNDMLLDLRAAESAPDDVYYYALVAPAATFSAYCGGSCVTGQSFVPEDARDAELRVGSGLGFTGMDSAWTMVHEVGHLHGRFHAPCGVSSFDSRYPYLDGDIGVWGYDPTAGTLIEPEAGWTDFMGYCDDQWVSDYTFRAIFERVIVQRGGTVLRRSVPWIGLGVRLDAGGGDAGRGAALGLRGWSRRPTGPRAPVQYLDALGRTVGLGEATRLLRSHESDSRWVIDPPPGGAARARILGFGTVEL